MAYDFSMSEQDTAPLEKEQVVGQKKKPRYKMGFSNLNKENVMGAAVGPNFYGEGSTSEKAKKKLRNILKGAGYDFGDMDEKTGGLDYHAIMKGSEP